MIVTRHFSGRTPALVTAIALLVASACNKKTETTPSPTPTPCSVASASATTSFGADGGSGSISVTAPTGCAWTATSGASFVSITQGASGSGNGTVQFAVAPNTGAVRTAAVTITGTTITITQAAPASTTPPTIAAPALRSPIGGQVVDSLKPTLTVANAATTGNVGTVTYRFEISEIDSFPVGSRTAAQDGVAQGSNTTSFTVTEHELAQNQLYFWRARATNGTITSAFSNTETFRTPAICTFTVSPTTISAGAAAGTATVTVTAGTACAWTAASNDAFITVTSGASGTGNGTVAVAIAANSGAARTGTLTIAGQTVTVSQSGAGQSAGLVVSFRMFDFARQGTPTTECQFRSLTGDPTTCTLDSTSFALGTNVIVSYAWTVQYTYVTPKTLTGIGPTKNQFTFTDTCGQFSSTDDGVSQPLIVTLTVTDNLGNTATATSGTGGQPPLVVRLFTCGL